MLNLIHNMNRDSCRTVDGIASETYVLHSLNAKAAPTVTVTVAPNNVVSRSLGCRFIFSSSIPPVWSWLCAWFGAFVRSFKQIAPVYCIDNGEQSTVATKQLST